MGTVGFLRCGTFRGEPRRQDFHREQARKLRRVAADYYGRNSTRKQ